MLGRERTHVDRRNVLPEMFAGTGASEYYVEARLVTAEAVGGLLQRCRAFLLEEKAEDIAFEHSGIELSRFDSGLQGIAQGIRFAERTADREHAERADVPGTRFVKHAVA